MTSKTYPPVDITHINTYSLAERQSKVTTADFGKPWNSGGSFTAFLESLPAILGAEDLRAVIDALATAYRNDKTVLFGMGAHVIKVGLNPVVIDLMQRGVISAVAMNGAGIIHDFEIAFAAKTSEDVSATLGSGRFGMARETGQYLSEAVRLAAAGGIGLGAAVGRMINAHRFPHREQSILSEADRLGLSVTVHIAMGTDILHMHPDFDPAAAGAASHRDFRQFAAVVADLSGGVFLNVGSAVILPEVFLKALTLARNIGHDISGFTSVNMDFIRHYRPLTNVVNRPTLESGRGINLVGQHEILLPLIAAGVIEQIDAI